MSLTLIQHKHMCEISSVCLYNLTYMCIYTYDLVCEGHEQSMPFLGVVVGLSWKKSIRTSLIKIDSDI